MRGFVYGTVTSCERINNNEEEKTEEKTKNQRRMYGDSECHDGTSPSPIYVARNMQ